MSARYSTSPALHLKIGESRLRALLYTALCFVCVYVLWLLYARGYVIVVVMLTPLVTYLLWAQRRDPMAGAELRWSQGQWTLEQAGLRRVIIPGKRSTATPWVIYMAFTVQPVSATGHLWLFVDCAAAAQLRRLRVRLTLEC